MPTDPFPSDPRAAADWLMRHRAEADTFEMPFNDHADAGTTTRLAGCGDERAHYGEAWQWVPVMGAEPGEFHWRGGMTFKRLPCGCVRIAIWGKQPADGPHHPGQWFRTILGIVPAAQWDSVVRETAGPRDGEVGEVRDA